MGNDRRRVLTKRTHRKRDAFSRATHRCGVAASSDTGPHTPQKQNTHAGARISRAASPSEGSRRHSASSARAFSPPPTSSDTQLRPAHSRIANLCSPLSISRVRRTPRVCLPRAPPCARPDRSRAHDRVACSAAAAVRHTHRTPTKRNASLGHHTRWAVFCRKLVVVLSAPPLNERSIGKMRRRKKNAHHLLIVSFANILCPLQDSLYPSTFPSPFTPSVPKNAQGWR